MHFAARTYSLPRSWRTSVRTTLAMLVQLVRPMTSDMLQTVALPRIACNQHHRAAGSVRSTRISVRRISSVIEPHRRAAAQRAEHDGDHRGDGRRAARRSRSEMRAAVPDHGEDVAPHRVRPEEELPARRSGDSGAGPYTTGRASSAGRSRDSPAAITASTAADRPAPQPTRPAAAGWAAPAVCRGPTRVKRSSVMCAPPPPAARPRGCAGRAVR